MSIHRRAFFRHLYRSHCRFSEDREEVKSIGDGIQKMVWEILCTLGKRNPLFEISKMIPCGSYFEETKVGSPDEFDFMIVLANLSQENSIEIRRGCSSWYPRVKVLRNRDKWHKYLAHNSLDEDSKKYLDKPSKMSNDFWKEISAIIQNAPITISTLHGTIRAVKSPLQKLQFEYRENFVGPENKEPGLVHLKTITIGVDLMLAIELHDTKNILKNPNVPPAFSSYVEEHGCHVITKSCHCDHFPDPQCWFLTFAACELALMQNMTGKHKEAYKILKCLLIGEINFPGKCMNLSSYMLKTALMYHVHGDDKCSNPSDYSTCIFAILEYLKTGFDKIRMPCFFARDLHTWGYLLEVPCFNWKTEWTDDEMKIGVNEMYTLLWLRFWYQAIEASKSLLTEEFCRNQDNWQKIVDRFNLYKVSVRFLIDKYCTSAEAYKSQLSSKHMKSDRLSLIINARFPDYMKRLYDKYNMKVDVI